MWVGAKEGVSQNKPRKSARRRVLELEISPWEGTGRKLALGGTPASRGKGLRDSLRGRGGIGAGSPSAGSGARESPPPHGPALCSPRSIWGCRPLVAAIAAASRAVPRQARAAAWPRAGGPLSSSSPPPPGSGPTAGARGGGPAARGDRNLASQRRGSLPISPRPGLFRSRQRRRRLLPDAPAGACSREERERPVRPGLEAPAAAAAAARSTGPASRVRGALTGARAPSGGGPGRWGPRDNRRRAHGFRFRFCLPGPGRVQRARARPPPPPPPTFWASPSDFGEPPHAGSLRGARIVVVLATPRVYASAGVWLGGRKSSSPWRREVGGRPAPGAPPTAPHRHSRGALKARGLYLGV